MFCHKCGTQIPDGNEIQFCPNCGVKLHKLEEAASEKPAAPQPQQNQQIEQPHIEQPTVNQQQIEQPAVNIQYDEEQYTIVQEAPADEKPPKKKKKLFLIPIIIAASLILIGGAGAGVWYGLFYLPQSKAEDCVKQAEQYMKNEKYDRTINAYTEALEYDKKCEAAYIGIAEAYAKTGEYQKAMRALENGLSEMSSDKLKNKLEDINKQFKKSLEDKYEETAAYGPAPATETPPAAEDPAYEEPQEPESKLVTHGNNFNIYTYNEEFKSRVESHYPGYERIDDRTGRIGSVTVHWNIIPSDDNAYQNYLDEALTYKTGEDAVDMFIVEADYAMKYIDTDYTLPISSLGITDDELSEQYQFTKDIGTNSDGTLKSVSWLACPTVMIYNRKIAKKVFGSDNPDTVQQAVRNWDAYNDTAYKVASNGAKMNASSFDTARIYMNNVSSPWVRNGVLDVDNHMREWAESTANLISANSVYKCGMWGDEWYKGFYGGIFCYFGPPWFYNYIMAADDYSSVAGSGGWGVCCGPEPGYWGGAWICVGDGCDNMDIAADIIRKLTTDEDIMADIFYQDDDFVNNRVVMEYMAYNTSYSSYILGGQNPLPYLCENAAKLRLKTSPYDENCFGEYQGAVWEYFIGNIPYDSAVNSFKNTIRGRFPELR